MNTQEIKILIKKQLKFRQGNPDLENKFIDEVYTRLKPEIQDMESESIKWYVKEQLNLTFSQAIKEKIIEIMQAYSFDEDAGFTNKTAEEQDDILTAIQVKLFLTDAVLNSAVINDGGIEFDKTLLNQNIYQAVGNVIINNE
jgi:hypothetical protein